MYVSRGRGMANHGATNTTHECGVRPSPQKIWSPPSFGTMSCFRLNANAPIGVMIFSSLTFTHHPIPIELTPTSDGCQMPVPFRAH